MQAVLDTIQNIGIFIAFLAARFAVLLVVLAALTVVFLAGLAVVRLVGLARRRALGLTRVDGLMWRAGVFFSPGHAWLEPRERGALRVGLDDLAQHVLSRISEVILPSPGQLVRAGEPAAIIRAGKRRAADPSSSNGPRRRRQPAPRVEPHPDAQRSVRGRLALRWCSRTTRPTRRCPAETSRASGSRARRSDCRSSSSTSSAWRRPTAANWSHQGRRC